MSVPVGVTVEETVINCTVGVQGAQGIQGETGTPAIGAAISGGTEGSVLFVDASGNLAQDNTKLFWDDTSKTFKVVGTIEAADSVLSRPEIKDYSETKSNPASSSGTLTLDCENGNVFETTLTENVTTLAISNPSPTGKLCSVTLIINQGAASAYTFAYPAGILWAAGTAPTITATLSGIDVVTFFTSNAGSTWYGIDGGQAFATV